jgi:hypothetical protein
MLSSSAIARQGIGFRQNFIALQGFATVQVAQRRRRGGVPKDVLELYVLQQLREIEQKDLERILRKAERTLFPGAVQAARDKPLPAQPTVDDTAKALAAILRKAHDSSLAKSKSTLARAEIDARNDEDLLLMIL